MQKIISNIRKELENEVTGLMADAEHLGVTIDGWTNTAKTTSFMGMTAHFFGPDDRLMAKVLDCRSFHCRETGDNIKSIYFDVADQYGIRSKIVCSVTDNASNMQSGLAKTGIRHFGCFDHTLALATNDSLKAIPLFKDTHLKMTGLVTFMKQSTNTMDDFEGCKKRLGETRRLIQDVDTLWNSTYRDELIMSTRFHTFA